MKAQRTHPSDSKSTNLRRRLQEAEETLDAIRGGEVDALVVAGPDGERVFTLRGAEHPYRVMVESMNEGAISLALDGTILYCNSAFARMIDTPLDHVMGHKLAEFVAPDEQTPCSAISLQRGRSKAIRAEIAVALVPRVPDCPRRSRSTRSQMERQPCHRGRHHRLERALAQGAGAGGGTPARRVPLDRLARAAHPAKHPHPASGFARTPDRQVRSGRASNRTCARPRVRPTG